MVRDVERKGRVKMGEKRGRKREDKLKEARR